MPPDWRNLEDLSGVDEWIEWALKHPGLSPWSKEVLRNAREQDPVVVMNEIEVLRELLIPWARAQVRIALERRSVDGSTWH